MLTHREEPMDVEQAAKPDPASADHQTSHEPEPEWVQKMRGVVTVLGGAKTVALHQEFLIRNNHTDLQILKNTKVSLLHDHDATTYSGTPLLWTPWGPSKVSCMERCPHFRGKFLLRKHIWDIAKCP